MAVVRMQDVPTGVSVPTSPSNPGRWQFFKQGSATSTGTTIDSEGNVTAAGIGTFASLITGSITTLLDAILALVGSTANKTVLTATVTGDANARYVLNANGTMNWGSGAAPTDTNLYRASAGQLQTDGILSVGGNLTTGGSFTATGTSTVGGLTTAGTVTMLNAVLTGQASFSGVATNNAISAMVTGDTGDRIDIRPDGTVFFGGGAGATDVKLYRQSADKLAIDDDWLINLAGKGLRVKEGTNAKQGTSTLVAGTVVVANTSVTATSRIFLTAQSVGGTAGALAVTARTAGTSFTITSTNAADTSVVAWHIFEPA